MARTIPDDRLQRLAEVAIEVFINRGYRLTQMEEVAKALGVSKGSIYNYVESKEALFAFCLKTTAQDPDAMTATLPIATPKKGALLRELKRESVTLRSRDLLTQALKRKRSTDIEKELSEIIGEMYDENQRFAVVIKLIETAVNHPELSTGWQQIGRVDHRDRLQEYLESRVRSNQLRSFPDMRVRTRFIIECIATWAMHIRWDPSPEEFELQIAKENLVDVLVRGMIA